MKTSATQFVKRFASRTLFVCSLLIGGVVFLVGVAGVIDPVGSKLADDSDPFGDPGNRWPAILLALGGLVIAVAPIAFARFRNARSANLNDQDSRK